MTLLELIYENRKSNPLNRLDSTKSLKKIYKGDTPGEKENEDE